MKTLARINTRPSLSFFDELFTPVNYWLDDFVKKAENFFPPVNIQETENSFELEVVAPGLEKGDFKIKTEGDLLTISAEKKEEKKEKNDKTVQKEYSYRSFSRAFTLNDDIDQEKVEAKYKDGVLYLTLPKKEEKMAKLKEIAIK